MSEKRHTGATGPSGDQPKAKRQRFSASSTQSNGVQQGMAAKDQQAAKPVLPNGLPIINKQDLAAKTAAMRAKLEALKAKQPGKGIAAQSLKPGTSGSLAPPSTDVIRQTQAASAQPASTVKLPPPVLPPSVSLAKQAAPEEPKVSYFDPFLPDKTVRKRHRAGFDFVKPGSMQKDAEQGRIKAALGEDAFKRQAQLKEEERRQAAENAVADPNLVPLGTRSAPKQPVIPVLEPVPEMEWWDSLILANPQSYEEDEESGKPYLNESKITQYVEHPVPLDPPAEDAPPPPMPLALTQKERKKLRTQRRVEKEKEKQELQRQGLLDPQKPKLKLSTFYRSKGVEAAADPTAVEQQVRAEQDARIQAHEDRNLASKKTPAERREKKIEKLVGAANEGEATPVSVYRVNRLESKQHRFKVRINAEELHMTGCAVITDAVSVIIVEGGYKAQKKYAHIVQNRIKWNDGAENEDDTDIDRTEAAARKFLEDRGIGHYWNLAVADKVDE